MNRLNWWHIGPIAAAIVSVFLAAVLGAHAYGMHQERHAHPKRLVKP